MIICNVVTVAEFSEKYFKKGQMVSVVGRLQIGTWEDNVDVIVEEQHFAESKTAFESRGGDSASRPTNAIPNERYPDTDDEDLQF